ncbi:MAG: lysylphosphatidylglycerol synthase transmembrane domain-containing protein [Acidimicrobiia bacterium]
MTEGAPEPPQDAADVPSASRPVWWKQLLSIGITVLVLVLVFGFVLPQVADYREIMGYLTDISTAWWIVLGVISVWFLVAYPIVLTTTIRTLNLREAFVNHMTGTAITNSLPSGGAIAIAVNYAMYLSWGFTPEAVSAGLLAGGVWDWFARIALPALAVFAIAIVSVVLPWMWLVSIAGVLWVAFAAWLLAKVLRSEAMATSVATWVDGVVGRIFGWIKRDPPGTYDAILQFRIDLRTVLSDRVWPLTAATVANHMAMASLFTASIYAVGVSPEDIPIPWAVLAFALGRFLVMIPVSPGGLGLVDLGWIGLLTLGWQTANPGEPVDHDVIAAGVLLFRGLSLLPPIPIGMGTWVFWRFNKSWRQPWRTVRRGETVSVSEGQRGLQIDTDNDLDSNGQ